MFYLNYVNNAYHTVKQFRPRTPYLQVHAIWLTQRKTLGGSHRVPII